MAETDKDLHKELGIKVGPHDFDHRWLQLSVGIVIPNKQIKDSINYKNDVENKKTLLMFLINVDIHSHIYRIKYDIYYKHNLNQVVPLKIPVVVRTNNKPTNLLPFILSFLVILLALFALGYHLLAHNHLVHSCPTNILHVPDDLNLSAYQAP